MQPDAGRSFYGDSTRCTTWRSTRHTFSWALPVRNYSPSSSVISERILGEHVLIFGQILVRACLRLTHHLLIILAPQNLQHMRIERLIAVRTFRY